VSVDQDGIITLCECKLEKNAGPRREVLEQVLEYAGSFAGMAFEEFAARVSDRLDTGLVGAMGKAAAEDFEPVVWTEAVESNLRSGTFRLVVAHGRPAADRAVAQRTLRLSTRGGRAPTRDAAGS
jgi:hypothetical protein